MLNLTYGTISTYLTLSTIYITQLGIFNILKDIQHKSWNIQHNKTHLECFMHFRAIFGSHAWLFFLYYSLKTDYLSYKKLKNELKEKNLQDLFKHHLIVVLTDTYD